MEHERYQEWMSAALDGELGARERRELEEHLARCAGCARLFRELSEQSAALRELDCPAPEGLQERVMAALPEQDRAPARRNWGRWTALAACAALVVAIGAAGAAAGRMGATGSSAPRAGEAPYGYSASDGNAVFGNSASGGAAGAPQEPQYAEAPRCDEPDPAAGEPAPAAGEADPEDAQTEVGLSGEGLRTTSGEGVKITSPPEAAAFSFANEQVFRLQWTEDLEAPKAWIVGSEDSLAGLLSRFPDSALQAGAARYDEAYFENGALLAVTVTASSGSVRFSLESGGLESGRVSVERETPEAGTCDMAAWLILAEVDASFADGQELEVVFRETQG